MAANQRTYIKDTALLDSYLTYEDGTPAAPTAVTWEFVNPNKQDLIVSALPSTPTTGDRVMLSVDSPPFSAWDVVEWTGSWNAISAGASTLTGNHAQLMIPAELIDITGIYMGISRWTTDGTLKSTPVQFEAVDPLDRAALTPVDEVVDMTWMRLEDLFDSELGGPHMRDRTLRSFDKLKLSRFLPGSLYRINTTYQPETGYDETNFPFDTHSPLLAQALLVDGIRHLMRTYVEQPQPIGSNVTHFDRRDYLSRWQSLYTMEDDLFKEWIDLFKRDLMGFGNTSILIGGYAGFYGRHPRFMRSGYPYISRYW